MAKAASFFEEDASEDRKRLLRDNLAKLPSDGSFVQTFSARVTTCMSSPRSRCHHVWVMAEMALERNIRPAGGRVA